MSEVFTGAFLALMMLNGLVIGFIMGQRSAEKKEKRTVSSTENALSVEDLEQMRKEREEMIAEQKAFLSMMGYNADVAYGMNRNPLEGS